MNKQAIPTLMYLLNFILDATRVFLNREKKERRKITLFCCVLSSIAFVSSLVDLFLQKKTKELSSK